MLRNEHFCRTNNYAKRNALDVYGVAVESGNVKILRRLVYELLDVFQNEHDRAVRGS